MNGDFKDYLIAYEFYIKEKNSSSHLIGILPERRKNEARITYESVMNWGKKVLIGQVSSENFYCVRVKVERSTGEIKESGQLTPNAINS